MTEILHISFGWIRKPPDPELQKVMNKAIDWLNYYPNCWLVASNHSTDVWFGRLERFIEGGNTFMILKINPSQKQGWMNKNVWEWLEKKRE